jgi:hypothetical protein
MTSLSLLITLRTGKGWGTGDRLLCFNTEGYKQSQWNQYQFRLLTSSRYIELSNHLTSSEALRISNSFSIISNLKSFFQLMQQSHSK